MRTMESLVDAFDDFGLIRKEPVLGASYQIDLSRQCCSPR